MKRLIAPLLVLASFGSARAAGVAAGAPADDWHGERAGSGFSGTLVPPYLRGAALGCADCHDPHGANPYRLRATVNGRTGIAITDGNSAKALCGACHAGAAADWHQTCVSQCHADPPASDPHPGFGLDHIPGESADCLACHGHGRDFVHTSTCLNCHGELELHLLGVDRPFPVWSRHLF